MKQLQRVVVKVGSAVLTQDNAVAKERMRNLVKLLCALKKNQTDVILVSSGAVAAGYTKLRLDKSHLPNKQALAAIGQPHLLTMYQNKFTKQGYVCAQVLLSAYDFDSRKRTAHAINAIEVMLANDVIPIVNENDVTATDELLFGDNDRLSAHVTHFFGADLLVILSDIDGYFDKNPKLHSDAILQPEVTSIDKSQLCGEIKTGSEFGTGGIVTKLQAADFLLKHNKMMFLASGFDLSDVYSFLIDHKHVGGTLFRGECSG